MPETAQHIALRIEAEGRKAAAFLRALNERDLARLIYSESPPWTARQILAHLTSAQMTVRRTLESVMTGGPGLDRTMNLDAFNAEETRRLGAHSSVQLIEQFESDCTALAARVAALAPDDMTRRVWHPWLGDTTIEETLRLAYRHVMMHIRDVRRAVAPAGREASVEVVPAGEEEGRPPSRAAALSLFLREAHVQSWPHIQRLAAQAGAVVVYPGEPRWTVRDLLAHLADSERGMLRQAQRVVRGEPALPEDFDLARWNRRAVQKRAAAAIADLLAEIESAHHDWVKFIESLDDAALDRQGRSAEGALLTVEGFAREAAEHRMNHTCDAEKAARAAPT